MSLWLFWGRDGESVSVFNLDEQEKNYAEAAVARNDLVVDS